MLAEVFADHLQVMNQGHAGRRQHLTPPYSRQFEQLRRIERPATKYNFSSCIKISHCSIHGRDDTNRPFAFQQNPIDHSTRPKGQVRTP